MTFDQSLNVAEIDADLAHERYVEALNADDHPELIDMLLTEAQLAQQRYDELLHFVPAA